MDYNVVYRDLPIGVPGLCRENEDDSYTIVLNSRYSHEANLHTLFHEQQHIRRNEFRAGVRVCDVEER